MDFDQDVANWVLESYLRQPLDYKTLDSVLNSLPFPRENPKLQKLVLLKKLESEVSERPVSETTLELMERLEEVAAAASDAMRRAYCAAAVDCTLRRVNIGGYEFFERVKKVWWSRIGRMKKNAAERGLGSDLLWEWKEMMETAVFDDGVAERVLRKFEGVCAVEAVMVYLREETEKMTPSFLELVADATKIDSVLQKIMGVNMIQPVAEVAASGTGVVHSSGGTTVNNAPKPSLMERNSSARTLQWDDSIDGSQEDIACRVELRVPSQKRRNTSPLRIYEANDKKKRRPVRKWSLREEETLREAVEECGEGNWKVILNAHLDIFEGRTQVDLKDKWRNMLRDPRRILR